MGRLIVVMEPVSDETLRQLHAIDGGSDVLVVAARSALLEAVRDHSADTVAVPAGAPDTTSAAEFLSRLDSEIARSTRYRRPLSIVLIVRDPRDGTDAIQEWTDAIQEGLKRLLRSVDATTRLASGEIALLLPETGVAGAEAVAARALRLASALMVKAPTDPRGAALPMRAACRVGIAVLEDGDTPDRMVARARVLL